MGKLPARAKNECEPSLKGRDEEHRDWIGGRAITLLSHYWRDDDPVELTAAIGQDWADVLEGLPREAIQAACVQYLREEPAKKPRPGAIYQRARRMLPPAPKAPPPAPRSDVCDAETAKRILDEVGFELRRFG